MALSKGIHRPHILVVEDDRAIRRIVELFLAEEGLEVASFGDPKTAISSVAAPANLQLVVTNVRLPGPSGPELMVELRRHTPQLRALFITGGEPEKLRGLPGVEPTDEILSKPFEKAKLLQLVRRLLANGDRFRKESTGVSH